MSKHTLHGPGHAMPDSGHGHAMHDNDDDSDNSVAGPLPIRVNRFAVNKLLNIYNDAIPALEYLQKRLADSAKKIFKGKPYDEKNDNTLNDAATVIKNLNETNELAKFYINQNKCVFRCFYESMCAPAQDDPRWLVMRNKGIGASEAEMPMKDDHLITKQKWIKSKAGLLPGFAGNEATEYGHQMEPVVGHILEDIFRTSLLESSSLEHPKYPFIRASLDRYGWIKGMPYIIEIKSPSSRVPKNGYIKPEYDKQMYQQHEVSGIEYGIFADARFQSFDTYQQLIRSFVETGDDLVNSKKYYGCIIRFPHSKRVFTYSPPTIGNNLLKWVKEKKIELKQEFSIAKIQI